MKKVWVLTGVFVAVLAAVVGARMSAEALAVVIGVVCGVGASVPVSLMLLTFLSRKDQRREEPRRDYPPVVIVNPGGTGAAASFRVPMPMSGLSGEPARTFHIVGDDDCAPAAGPRGGFRS